MTEPIDCFATMGHYFAHLLPIFNALPEDRRGYIYAPSNLRREIQGERVRYTWPPSADAPLIVAGYQDLNHGIRGKVLVNHGSGATYFNVDSASYDGGPGREQVGLFLCPNQASVDKNLARYPRASGAAVGAAKLDAWRDIPAPNDGTVGVTFHWPCRLRDVDGNNVPESGWAWESWRDAVAELAKSRKVLGHGHPRARYLLEEYWASIGVEAVWDATEWISRCDTIVVDNSSIGYEAAAVGRGVVWLDDVTWRPDVEHGLRFWSQIPGPHLHPAEGIDGLLDAIDRVYEWASRRAQVTRDVYGVVDGHASERAVDAILKWEVQL